MLEQCNYSKQCRNSVATLCCAKNRRCESSRVTSPLHAGTICNNDLKRITALQHCCDIVSNSCNIVPTFETSVALKIVAADRSV